MFACLTEQPAQAYHAGTIELQGSDSSTARCGQPDYLREVLSPAKMVLPTLLARMEKRHIHAVYRIGGSKPVELVAVTALSLIHISLARH